MTCKIYAIVIVVLSFALPTCAQHLPSQPVLDVSDMDRTIDPCTDFYTYSCGGWIKNNPIPPDQSSWSTYGKLEDENRGQLRSILDAASKASAVPNASAPVATQKIGDYYASCMDEAAIDKLGKQPLLPQLARIERLGSKQDLAK